MFTVMRPVDLKSAFPRMPSTSALVKAPFPHSTFSRAYCLPVAEEKTTAPFSALASSLITEVTTTTPRRFNLPVRFPEWHASMNTSTLPAMLATVEVISDWEIPVRLSFSRSASTGRK